MTGSDRPASSQAAAAFQRRPGLLAWLVLTPLLAWLILFVIVPTIMLVLLSLGEQKGPGNRPFHFHFEELCAGSRLDVVKGAGHLGGICRGDHRDLHGDWLSGGVFYWAFRRNPFATS